MIIYLVTNKINGLKYVGQTTQKFAERKRVHIHKALSGSKYFFHRALKKHGIENFEWEIIDEASSLEELNKLEIYYIKKYNTFLKQGYNLTNGGRGCSGWKHTEETKKRIKQKLEKIKKPPHTKETKEKIRKWQKGKSYVEKYGKERADKIIKEKKKSYIEKFGKKRAKEIIEKIKNNNKSSTKEFKKKISLAYGKRLDGNGKRTDLTEIGRKNISNSKKKDKNPNYININNETINLIINEYIKNNKKVTKTMIEKINLSVYLIKRILKDNKIYESKKN